MAKRRWGEGGRSFGPGAECSQGGLGFIPHRRGGGGLSAPGEAGETVEKEEGRWGMAVTGLSVTRARREVAPWRGLADRPRIAFLQFMKMLGGEKGGGGEEGNEEDDITVPQK